MKKMNKKIKSLKIEKHALGGYGLGFDDGLAIFVPYAHPGDVVDVAVTKSRKDHAFAEVQSYISRAKLFLLSFAHLSDPSGPVEAAIGKTSAMPHSSNTSWSCCRSFSPAKGCR